MRALDLSANALGHAAGLAPLLASGFAGFKSVAAALKLNTILTSLDLSRNGLDDGAAAELAGALRGHLSLITLRLGGNALGAAGAAALAAALLPSPGGLLRAGQPGASLTSLSLGGCCAVGDAGAFAFADALKSCRRVDLQLALLPHLPHAHNVSEGI